MAERYMIIKDGIAHHAIIADETYASGTCIRTDTAQEGDAYVDGKFIPPVPPNVFEFIVTDITSDDPGNIIKPGLSSILCKEGTTVTASIEARVDGVLLPLNDYFRTPITASDGRERIVLTVFNGGICRATHKIDESGFWSITQDGINRNSGSTVQFLFKGLNIDVVG